MAICYARRNQNQCLSSSNTYAVPDGLSRLFGQITMGWNAHSCHLFVESNSTRPQSSRSATFVDATPSVIVVRWHNVHGVGRLLHWARTSLWRHLYFLVRVHHFAVVTYMWCMCDWEVRGGCRGSCQSCMCGRCACCHFLSKHPCVGLFRLVWSVRGSLAVVCIGHLGEQGIRGVRCGRCDGRRGRSSHIWPAR